jgi:hypothetical protein
VRLSSVCVLVALVVGCADRPPQTAKEPAVSPDEVIPNPEQQAIEYIQSYVRYGFYQSAEVEQIVFEDVFNGAIPRERLRELIKAEVARHQAEQRSWPTVTDCERLDRAFTALEAEGILAIHNAGNEASDGITEVSEQYRAAGGAASRVIGYCFYHRQDMEYALNHDELGLAFGDINGDRHRGVKIGERVRSALLAAGLQVTWSGSIDDKLAIKAFRWQRRNKNA